MWLRWSWALTQPSNLCVFLVESVRGTEAVGENGTHGKPSSSSLCVELKQKLKLDAEIDEQGAILIGLRDVPSVPIHITFIQQS
ncbi:hypothetical protein L1987_72776 [Smallanthus sonchifolius]|uniref:Uncharacterized protein n=1 Tax=Smallanthus sonchifolius TaxID=185202 RepID=A0ACB9AWU4_9ASTR|nr:hypothetical protein L1987_72776 [Smallanthus sonchifolius]